MNIMKLILPALYFSSAMCIADPISDQIYLNYGGTVVVPPCTIATPSVPVDFGNIKAGELETPDSATEEWIEAKVSLTGCSGVSKYGFTVTAQQDSATPQYLANTGTAEHLAVEAMLGIIPIENGYYIENSLDGNLNADMNFKFRIHNNGTGAATPGSVVSVVTLTFTFR